MVALSLLDTNVLVRHLRQDHASHSPRATAFLARVQRGEVIVRLVDTVVFETVFTLEKVYKQSRTSIRTGVLPILLLPGIVLPGKRWVRRAFDLYVQYPRLSFADCYHAVQVERFHLGSITSFDQGYDRLPGFTREEP